MSHLNQEQLALAAGGDTGWLQSFAVKRHLHGCPECQEQVAEFTALRAQRFDVPDLNWNALAAEMRANIHLGLEAGECVRRKESRLVWNPRLAAAFGCLALLAGAGVWLRPGLPIPVAGSRNYEAPRLESTGSGLELRLGSGSSMTLLNHAGSIVSQTVSAQGAIRARNIDGDTGSVTINHVYLE